jgi:outer membrane cobalamin receptor
MKKIGNFLLALIFLNISYSQNSDEQELLELMDMLDILNTPVVSASLKKQSQAEAPSNIIVITKKMIEQRAYKNLIEVLQDVPGFDFATYEDGGGEYPSNLMNRGIGGDAGSSKLLIMVDGVIQNHISNNWAQGLTNEQSLLDVERIEIVQGPGSALYGANAYSGIVHLITNKNFEGLKVEVEGAANSTMGLRLLYGKKFNDINFTLMLNKFNSDGDGGDRYDPDSLFIGHVAPDSLSQEYDEDGTFLGKTANPHARETVPKGFNTSKDDFSLRAGLAYKDFELKISYWKLSDGLGSYVAGQKYYMNKPGFRYIGARSGLHSLMKYTLNFSKQLKFESNLVYRETNILPETGFTYTYRFYGKAKTYHSVSTQTYLENRLFYDYNEDHQIIFGSRFLTSSKMPNLVSLNEVQELNSNITNSAYGPGLSGDGLGVKQYAKVLQVFESAYYLMLNSTFSKYISSSIGLRYDKSDEYGETYNPRIAFVTTPVENIVVKLLYGSAFRQPSFFEISDEFRGNENLEPEKIDTYELEANYSPIKELNIKGNIFLSKMTDNIIEVKREGQSNQFQNVGESEIFGGSFIVNYQPVKGLITYLNYSTAIIDNGNGYENIVHSSPYKVNFGLNFSAIENANINLRLNYVGKRKASETNTYFFEKDRDGYAPSYLKFNLSASYAVETDFGTIKPQLIIKNLFDEEYYGVGRQKGAGFIPHYHPQPGREIFLKMNYSF